MKNRAALRQARSRVLVPALVGLFLLAIWEGLSALGVLSTLFFPPPSRILATLGILAVNGTLGDNLGVTLARMGIGLLLGILPGALLGLVMGWMPRLRVIVDPFIAAFHPIPKTAIYPLVMILFGIGEPSKVVTIAVATFFPALINSMAGVRQIPPVYLEVAKNYGARHWKTFTRVILPGSLPMLLAGIRIAFNNALVITIAVELLVARKGLGVMIWFAWETLRTADLYATLVIIAAVGILANILLHRLSMLVAPWYRVHSLDEEKTS